MPGVVSGERRLRHRIIRGDVLRLADIRARAGAEKSPRRCRLGLNPPMKEVEETIGSTRRSPRFGVLWRDRLKISVGAFLLHCNMELGRMDCTIDWLAA